MSNQFHYTGENIPNEDPKGLDETREHMKAFAKAAEMEQEALARHLGGRPKMINHAAVEPEATIEDPALKDMSIDLQGINPYLEDVKSKYDNLGEITEDDMKIADRVRQEIKKENQLEVGEKPETELSPYSWRTSTKERFEYEKPSDKSKKSHNYEFWIVIFIIIILILASSTSLLCL